MELVCRLNGGLPGICYFLREWLAGIKSITILVRWLREVQGLYKVKVNLGSVVDSIQ